MSRIQAPYIDGYEIGVGVSGARISIVVIVKKEEESAAFQIPIDKIDEICADLQKCKETALEIQGKLQRHVDN